MLLGRVRIYRWTAELFLEMIGYFREDAPSLLEDLQLGIANKDAELVRRSAHIIKGLAASFDAAQVKGVASIIENLAHSKDLATASNHVAALRASIARLDGALAEFARPNR